MKKTIIIIMALLIMGGCIGTWKKEAPQLKLAVNWNEVQGDVLKNSIFKNSAVLLKADEITVELYYKENGTLTLHESKTILKRDSHTIIFSGLKQTRAVIKGYAYEIIDTVKKEIGYSEVEIDLVPGVNTAVLDMAEKNGGQGGTLVGGSIQGNPLNLTKRLLAYAGYAPFKEGTGDQAGVYKPQAVVKHLNHLFIADTANHCIRMIDLTTGYMNIVAGEGGLTGTADGYRAETRFTSPSGIAIDSSGQNMYITDTYNHTIRKMVIETGELTTIAGAPTVSGNVDGIGSSARFAYPEGITIWAGNLYVTDRNHTIKKIELATRNVVTIAGTGSEVKYPNPVDGTSTGAGFSFPSGIAVDTLGQNLYITDSGNHSIRKMDLESLSVSTFAGSTMSSAGYYDGTGTSALFNSPKGITVSEGNLIVADTLNHTVRKVNILSKAVETIAGYAGMAGSADGTGMTARFSEPYGVCADVNTIYVTDKNNNTIRQITKASPVVTTIAGSTPSIYSRDGTGIAARFREPHGITTDGVNLYVADKVSHLIRKIVINTGVVTTLAGNGEPGYADGTGTGAMFNLPAGITTDGTNLYVSEVGNHIIRKIVISTGVVTTIAGYHGASGSADGIGETARFIYPAGITINGENLYIADTFNNTIRKMNTVTNEVTTLAGNAGVYGSTDGTGAAARFNYPYGITTDGANLYVADTFNAAVRKVVISTGEVTTIAGTPGMTGHIDAAGADARFYDPIGITTDGTNLYVTEYSGYLIRKVELSNNNVTTVTGKAHESGYINGTGDVARLFYPFGITTDGHKLFFTEVLNNAVRIVE